MSNFPCGFTKECLERAYKNHVLDELNRFYRVELTCWCLWIWFCEYLTHAFHHSVKSQKGEYRIFNGQMHRRAEVKILRACCHCASFLYGFWYRRTLASQHVICGSSFRGRQSCLSIVYVWTGRAADLELTGSSVCVEIAVFLQREPQVVLGW